MIETSNGYIDLLEMPTDLRINLINDILDMKKIQKEKMDELKSNMSVGRKVKR